MATTIKEIEKFIKKQKSHNVRICLAHTHPEQTTKEFLLEDIKEKSIEEGLAVGGHSNLKRLTLSPSGQDLITIDKISRYFKKKLKPMGVAKLEVSGLVVGPVGYYYFRSFESNSERISLFPRIDPTPFDWLDNEEQLIRIEALDEAFFKVIGDWTNLVRIDKRAMSDLVLEPEYLNLKKSYAGYATSVKVRFSEDISKEVPCKAF